MKFFIKKIILFIINSEYHYISALIIRIFIKERCSNGKDKIIFSKPNNRITILALDSERYRGDLEVLASAPEFRVLHIKQKWQVLFLGRIYSDIYNLTLDDYFNAKPKDAIYNEILLAKKFTKKFLKKLISMIGIDCVTTVNYRYIEDLDWTIAAENNNIPYILLYRECLLQKETRFYDDVKYRHSKYKFHGSHIVVHNDTCKDSFVESGYCKESDVTTVGALRMDQYIKDTNKVIDNKNKRKTVVLFYFPYSMSLFGKRGKPPTSDYKYKYVYSIWKDRKLLFKDVHTAIAELSLDHPDIDFIIKPKKIMMDSKSWSYYEEVLKEIGFNREEVENYSVNPYADVHKLMLNSDVICALQSSTVIESSISGKPIILPIFKNYRQTDNYKDFTWRRYTDLFTVADDKNHFKKMILESINKPPIDHAVLDKRKKVFKKFFNDIEGVSLIKCTDVIINIVNNRNNS
jgi:hypothetical protein